MKYFRVTNEKNGAAILKITGFSKEHYTIKGKDISLYDFWTKYDFIPYKGYYNKKENCYHESCLWIYESTLAEKNPTAYKYFIKVSGLEPTVVKKAEPKKTATKKSEPKKSEPTRDELMKQIVEMQTQLNNLIAKVANC